jgi:predicted secreted protein
MDFINGVIRVLYIKKEGLYLPIGCLTSNSFSETVEMIGTTTRDNVNGWKSSRPTSQSYSISFDGLVGSVADSLTEVTYKDLKAIKRSRLLVEWRIGDTGLANYEYGLAYITGLGDSASIDEFISFNGSLEGFGEVTNSDLTYLLTEGGDPILTEDGINIILG